MNNFYFILLQINNLCNVTYRKFNYSKYPSHVQNLVLYAWKPLIVNVSSLRLINITLGFFGVLGQIQFWGPPFPPIVP